MTRIPNPVADPLARAAAATPDRVAVRDGATALTFSALATAVARTAGAVSAATAERPDAVVPVLVARDVDAVVGVLGVQHAGRAVAPVDAASAPTVLADLWRRAGEPPVVVAADPTAAAALPGVTVLTPGSGDPLVPQPVRPVALAAVLFTSGSTGVPKGVMYDWGLVAGAVTRWDDPILAGPPGATVGLLFPFHFWGGYQRLLGLVTGRPLVVVDPTRLDADTVLERLERDGVEVVGLVPTMIPVLAAAARASGRRLDRVRLVTLGGEAVTWHHVDLVRSFVSPEARMSNGYGGTESPLGSFRLEIPPERASGTGPVPIGVPVAPDRVHLEPVGDEPGAPRQIVVTGPVALGYFGDPELTARAFTAFPDGTRAWRTGDVAETGADGEVFHVGRLDDLVKISGNLVAPTRTEAALLTLPGVREAAVLAQTVAGRPRLVAHVVVDDTVTVGMLRAGLRTRLPAHQLPRVVVRHERLPVTSTNKVDRASLLVAPPDPWRDGPPTPAASLVELTVLARAGEVVGVPIGTTDDLWEFGLDSLGALELTAALRDEGWEVDPNALLDHPTPRALAAHCVAVTGPRTSPVVTMNAGGDRAPIWCIPGGGAPALTFRSLATALGDDQPVTVIEPRGFRTPGRPRLRISTEARDATDVVCATGDPRPVVVVGQSAGVAVAHELCRNLAAAGWAPHLVALDAGPCPPVRPAPPRSVRERLRRRSGLTIEAGAAAWRWLVPDPRPDRTEYDHRFLLYRRWALRRHRPGPRTFSAVLVRIADAAAEAQWPAPPDRVVVVGGDHVTMVHPPHVTAVAAAIVETRDALSP